MDVQGDSKTKSVNDKLKKHDIGGHVIEGRKPIPFGFSKKKKGVNLSDCAVVGYLSNENDPFNMSKVGTEKKWNNECKW